MTDEEFDPDRVKIAKELAAGPLGQEMCKFPLLFAKPLVFGQKPSKSQTVKIYSGTITFIKIEEALVGITCSHVIEEYVRRNKDGDCIFQIGNLEFSPLERILDQSSTFDIVTIDLEGIDVTQPLNASKIGTHFFNPLYWPPKPIKIGDYVALGGFPGEWRECPSWNSIVCNAWSNGGTEVSSIRDQYFICQFKREFWVEPLHYHYRDGLNLKELGGLSNGPVFINRGLYWELIGIIYEFSKEFDLMYIRPANLINHDGKIKI